MGKRTFVGGGQGIVIEDVDGSFQRFLTNAPKVARALLHDAVEKTAFALRNRMDATAPVGPDAPHIKEALTYKRRGMRAEVGILETEGVEPAAPGSTASMADVALYNEYRPNAQPFMLPAAEAETADFRKRTTDAIRQLERDLVGGGGLT